ncbi:glycosyltransferase [Rathayibacter sp. VKM Ac-2803]|uniref:glycosyltransferase n=1 Tax=Rathayibacter sp. VKM Ac-2803 TaxID=2609256 RepID=UPI00135AC4C8|nr:glycosyltransferase [Rathayibacter sp. VKM Ac-2803]MWV50410.1 glycosyltransferase [Rathayibacter sp. VKM Ac-2803]
MLYYGNYIPLHGLDLVLEALTRLPAKVEVEVVLIGGGSRRASVEKRVADLGLGTVCRFVDPVAEEQLAGHIAWSDVVLGVFGSSPKAKSVIANKVWQGLACGRTVLTQSSESLSEITDLVPNLLRTTRPGSAASIAESLAALAEQELPEDLAVDTRLDAYVEDEFRGVAEAVRSVARRGES